MSTPPKSDGLAAPVAKSKFVLSPALAATLPNISDDTINSTTAAPVGCVETVAPKMPLEVSNAEFIEAIFGPLPGGVSALVCSKNGDPTHGPWNAKSAAQVMTVCSANSNTYFNCSSFHSDADGTWRARKENLAAFHCLVLDDVGTKIPREKLNGFKASWAIETSPGNFQVGIVLDKPLTDIDESRRLQEAVINAGLCDPGATGTARWARLPVGINGKDKYRSDTGAPFICRLARFRPELRYTVEEIVARLNLVLAPLQPRVAVASTPMSAAGHEREVNLADVAKLPNLLARISPDCDRKSWLNVLMGVFHTTGGSDEGFELVDTWSSQCKTRYKGSKDVEVQWRSLARRASDKPPITIGTLISMARNSGIKELPSAQPVRGSFEPCVTITVQQDVISSATGSPADLTAATMPLIRYSLKDSLPELEKQKVQQVLIFGQLVLLGQAVVMYARPNTGKTLILLYLIIQAVKMGLIDPAKLIYINMDDNSSGLVDKVRLAQEYGFHMAADGHRGFQAKEFRVAMEKMIAENSARGVIVILDTLKKFVNTMNKDASREFTGIVRRFCLKGGTVIALSHVNKLTGANGKAVYTGTTDIVDDFDCAYTLETVDEEGASHQKFVEFTNIKRRGDVAMNAAYSYSIERNLPYDELLLSVQEVDPEQLEPIKKAAELQSDATVIAAVKSCITEGINTKMRMVDAASKSISASHRLVLQVIEKYTGEDSSKHRWKFVVRARGAKVYELLDGPNSRQTEPVSAPVQPASPAARQAVLNAPVTDGAVFHANILRMAMEAYGGGATGGAADSLEQDAY